MTGLILVDKPLNWTSFDVVAKLRGIVRAYTGLKVKVGHSGTLDPLATGLLIIAIGSHTKKLPELIKDDKTYEATIFLGETSSTGDAEGMLVKKANTKPTKHQIEEAFTKFTGNIEQIPPKFSAIKVDGRRAYDLARNGKEFELKPRNVLVQSIKLISYVYPLIDLVADVSSGTYVRSLAEDIGNNLGCGAYLKSLRRTKIGSFKVEDAVSLENINYAKINEHLFTLDK